MAPKEKVGRLVESLVHLDNTIQVSWLVELCRKFFGFTDDRITLGNSCQMKFELPVPGGLSARLSLSGGRRLPMAVDGVLLMAENLILGPIPPVHVLIPDATANIVIYRSKDGLSLRTVGAFTVDRRKFEDRATLQLPAHVASDSFSFALEPVGQKL